jgi:hypothetical protein
MNDNMQGLTHSAHVTFQEHIKFRGMKERNMRHKTENFAKVKESEQQLMKVCVRANK